MINRRTYLERQRTWLLETVIPGYEAQLEKKRHRGDYWEDAIARCHAQVADIDWLLADLTRKAPICGWSSSYADHPADCHYCATGKRRTSSKGNLDALEKARRIRAGNEG